MIAFLRSLPPRRRTATLLGWGLLISAPFLLLAAISLAASAKALVGTMLVIIITASTMLSKRLHILCFIVCFLPNRIRWLCKICLVLRG